MGTTVGVIQGDTRSLDNGSYLFKLWPKEPKRRGLMAQGWFVLGFRVDGLGLGGSCLSIGWICVKRCSLAAAYFKASPQALSCCSWSS